MAGLIPQAFIDDLLAKINIVDVIDKRVQLKRTGSNLKACCPFHQEKTPSFTVNEPKQFYYCFGCGAAGNAVGFLMEYENLTFPEAVESLAQLVGIEVPREADGTPSKPTIKRDDPLFATLEKAQQYFTHSLRKHKHALAAIDYLKGRGLSGVIARDFGLGFAPPGWRNLQPALTDESESNLLDSGMLVRNNDKIYDRYRNRITFPIRNTRGQLVGFGGRIIDPNDKPKYLNSPETRVFNKSKELYGLYEAKRATRQLSRLVIVEGYMDVIALAQAGIPYAVATLGTAVGEKHIQLLFRYCKNICFCFDGDQAGRKAAAKALTVCLPVIAPEKSVKFLFLPEGHDPDSLVREIGQSLFEDELDGATDLADYLFSHAADGKPVDSIDQRAKFTAKAKALISLMPGGDYKQLMLAELANRTGLSLDALQEIEAATLESHPTRDETPSTLEYNASAAAPAEHMEMQTYAEQAMLVDEHLSPELAQIGTDWATLLAKQTPEVKLCLMAFHEPHLAARIDAKTLEYLAENHPSLAELLRDIQTRVSTNPAINTGSLMGYWMPDEDKNAASSHLCGFERLWPSEGGAVEFSQTQQHLLQRKTRSEHQSSLDALKQIPISEMSDTQKQQLRELLANRPTPK